MDSALGWIGELVAWIANWVPKVFLVRKTERAVKFIRGRTVEIGPGLHVFWPITTEVDLLPVVRQVLDVGTQTLTTKDGQTVVAGGLLVYSIRDLHTFLVENYDAQDSIGDVGQAGIRKAVVLETFEKIQEGRADVDNRLTREAQKLLEPFGVSVEYMRLTTFAQAHVVSLLADLPRGVSP